MQGIILRNHLSMSVSSGKDIKSYLWYFSALLQKMCRQICPVRVDIWNMSITELKIKTILHGVAGSWNGTKEIYQIFCKCAEQALIFNLAHKKTSKHCSFRSWLSPWRLSISSCYRLSISLPTYTFTNFVMPRKSPTFS